MARADESARSGDFRAAAILYQQALSQEPTAEAFYRLGLSLRHMGRADGAIQAFRGALSLDADHAGALERLGLDLTSRGEVEEAAVYLRRLETLNPENWRVHNALGIVADLESRFADAEAQYAQALALRPESAKLWNNLGYSHYLAGNDVEALVAMRKALALQADYLPARNNIALVLARQGRYQDAIGVLARAGGPSDAHADVGYLAFRMGDYDEAELLLAEAIRLSPTFHQQAHRNLAAVREARQNASDASVEVLQDSFMTSLSTFFGEG
jgi:Flp pilus assembly protein TadD